MRRTRIRRKRRRFDARAYGSPERVRWIRSLPCSVCGDQPSQNAHVSCVGHPSGMGRKGDAEQIIPLCAIHHIEIHRIGERTFASKHSIDLDLTAAAIDCRWRERDERSDLAV